MLSLTLLYKKNVSEAADTSSLTVIGVGGERVGDCAGRKGCSDIQPACVGAQLCVCVFAHACLLGGEWVSGVTDSTHPHCCYPTV